MPAIKVLVWFLWFIGSLTGIFGIVAAMGTSLFCIWNYASIIDRSGAVQLTTFLTVVCFFGFIAFYVFEHSSLKLELATLDIIELWGKHPRREARK